MSVLDQKQILFVDDDPEILSGLRVRLHRLAGRWGMRFAVSGPAAIEELERYDCDLIIADVRMPGMDGVELLRIVSERWPHTIRIALSGYTGEGQVVRLIPYAHQYLNKPCPAPRLEELIARCLALHELVPDPGLRGLLGGVRTLPITIRAHTELQAALAQDSPGIGAVAAIVAADTGLTAKTLQLANSEFFRLARRLTNVEQAVGHLGLTLMRALVGSSEVFAGVADQESRTLRLDELQQHASEIAAAARSLAAQTAHADDAWAAGLLHDVGYWILARERQADLLRCLQLAAEQDVPLHEAERRLLGTSHAQLGAYLLGLWGIPSQVVEAVACHHAPQSPARSQFGPLEAITVAHALCATDDAEIFHGRAAATSGVGAAYLKSVNAPFDWAEAARRVQASCKSRESHS